MLTAACLAAVWMGAAGRQRTTDTALERAFFDWDRGDYVAALTTYRDVLGGPDAAAALEAIALQTGELFHTTELTKDGANPRFSPDGRRFSFETGPGVVAGVGFGRDRTTHIRATAAASTDQATLPGGDASFCPDGRHVAYLRVASNPDITTAQALVDEATTSAQRAPRVLALNRVIARTGTIVLRDLDTGAEQDTNTGGLLKTAILCGGDNGVLFSGAAESNLRSTDIYKATASASPEALTHGEGFKVPSELDTSGRALLFLMPGQGPFRTPSDTGTGRGGSGGGGNAASVSFGVLSAARKSTIVNGVAPTLSRDGRSVAWIERASAAEARGEQRLVMASTDAPDTTTVLHKGSERLDAPAIAPDGARVAFQIMSGDDWEIVVIDSDGEHESRVTREIQHDVLPRFLTNDRLLAAVGEPRHRRSYIYDLSGPPRTGSSNTGPSAIIRKRLFHNNTVRTIAPEYLWVPNSDGTRVLIVAERDGDTVSPERGVYLTDLSARVTLPELRDRVAANLEAERALKELGRHLFAPIADDFEASRRRHPRDASMVTRSRCSTSIQSTSRGLATGSHPNTCSTSTRRSDTSRNINGSPGAALSEARPRMSLPP